MRWSVPLLVFLAVMVPVNVWDVTSLGDPFRDGRVRDLVFLAAPMIAFIWSHRLPAWICMFWCWSVWLWAYWGMDAYGWAPIALTPLFLFFARGLVRLEPRVVMLALRVSYSIQAAMAIPQFLGWNPSMWIEHTKKYGPIGTIGQETLLGSFLAPLVIVALWEWSVAEALLGLVVVALCNSTMSVVALISALVVMVWKRLGLRSAAALGALCVLLFPVGLILKPEDNSFYNTSGRAYVWEVAWEKFWAHPWGWGPGSWAGLYVSWEIPQDKGTWPQLHSEPLSALFETGWIGLGIVLLGVALTLWNTRNPVKATILGGLFMNSIGNSTFHYPVTAFLFALALSMPEPDEA